MTDPLLLTPTEAARALGIGRSKLYQLLAAGTLESVHIGACRRIPVDALAAFVGRLRSGNPPMLRSLHPVGGEPYVPGELERRERGGTR